MDWLVEERYTHCFFVGGGNSMHLLEAASRRFKCIPVIHEVAAGIGAEYFNETSEGEERAFALVTAGPGITNIVTAIAGAWLESRELLVVGGQAKTTDLSHGRVRQIGHQEIDGTAMIKPLAKESLLVERRLTETEVKRLCRTSKSGRKGPIFLEMCIDVTAMPPLENSKCLLPPEAKLASASGETALAIANLILTSERPVLLIGGGVSRATMNTLNPRLEKLKLPLATTWNGFDRASSGYAYYAGRPNTYGMRWANIFTQQADLMIAAGTRLGVQQVGFAWDQYLPLGKLVQIDIDRNELEKGFPDIDVPVSADANQLLVDIVKILEDLNFETSSEWLSFLERVKSDVPLIDDANQARDGYLEMYQVVNGLGKLMNENDLVVPCSSGGSFTAMMQVFEQKAGQIAISNKGLASMGYGLSGAIGASLAKPGHRTVLVEGDGGFAQNLQEIGTVERQGLPIKMFIMSNEGYASIRTSQKSYFNGNYVGCDIQTGLGLPNWEKIFEAYGVNCLVLDVKDPFNDDFMDLFNSDEPAAFIVRLDPDQLFYPKVTSRVLPDGRMSSNPLHLMTPSLTAEVAARVMPYLQNAGYDITS
jgi:acetolactate synthase-1/2/3 large subunit